MKKEPKNIDLKWVQGENKYISTFKFFNTEGNNKGEYFSLNSVSEIYLPYHEKISEIYVTIEHEDIHRSLDYLDEDKNLSVTDEHNLIRFMFLMKDDLI